MHRLPIDRMVVLDASGIDARKRRFPDAEFLVVSKANGAGKIEIEATGDTGRNIAD